jgi:hypothetical protein
MNDIAERYVKLVLAMGQHDPAYVDAYYGPPEWQTEAERTKQPLAGIDADAARLIEEIGEFDSFIIAANTPEQRERDSELTNLRFDYLQRQLEALRTRVRMLSGTKLSFDEESQALYDAVAPTHPDAYFEALLADLEQRVPGRGPLLDRVEAYRRQFVIPQERLGRVFDLAIAECRRRTMRTCSCRRTRASRSSTSPASHGAATTGITAITGA